ncbi:MAG: DUF2459 domain-containing protein, partial [Haliea sp.]|nr:DUF2459 domain-containing protein [Haliea sp.]
MSEADIAALVAYIDASLLESGGALVPLRSYTENAGVFFESSKAYGLLNNCNTWTGEALQRGDAGEKCVQPDVAQHMRAGTGHHPDEPGACGGWSGVTPALAH